MNRIHLFAALVIVVVFSAPALAQHGHEAQPKDGQGQNNMSEKMGKSTFEQTTDGLTIRVWLITQTEHKKMMKDHGMMGATKKDRHEMMGMMHGNSAGKDDHQMMNDQMQHDGKGMDEEMMKSMLMGTHHIMVIVEDEATKLERESATIEVQAVSPTDKNSTVTLTRMMKHYGGGLTLDERGRYRITVVARDGDRVVRSSFDYGVLSTD
jgi:hypothetical protein